MVVPLQRVQLLLQLVEEDVLVLLLLRRELHGIDLLWLGKVVAREEDQRGEEKVAAERKRKVARVGVGGRCPGACFIGGESRWEPAGWLRRRKRRQSDGVGDVRERGVRRRWVKVKGRRELGRAGTGKERRRRGRWAGWRGR